MGMIGEFVIVYAAILLAEMTTALCAGCWKRLCGNVDGRVLKETRQDEPASKSRER